MNPYRIVFSKQAKKDIDKLAPKQKAKLQEILQNIISLNPYAGKPLKGDLKGLYSYRINLKPTSSRFLQGLNIYEVLIRWLFQ